MKKEKEEIFVKVVEGGEWWGGVFLFLLGAYLVYFAITLSNSHHLFPGSVLFVLGGLGLVIGFLFSLSELGNRRVYWKKVNSNSNKLTEV